MARGTSFAGVTFDPRALAELLRGPTGPVVRNAIVVAEQVKVRAQQRVGKDSHKLEHSIVKRVATGPEGVVVLVGSDLPYAILHHKGTRPHVIVAKAGGVLVFEVGGKKVFTRRVRHPGTKPNRFLTDAARDVGLTVRLQAGVL